MLLSVCENYRFYLICVNQDDCEHNSRKEASWLRSKRNNFAAYLWHSWAIRNICRQFVAFTAVNEPPGETFTTCYCRQPLLRCFRPVNQHKIFVIAFGDVGTRFLAGVDCASWSSDALLSATSTLLHNVMAFQMEYDQIK